MASVNAAEAVVSLVLTFFLPGFALARATFPEWRFRGPNGTIRLLETLTLSLFGSVALTVILGFGLLNSPVGFGATWSDPVLFGLLAAVAAVGLAAAAIRGAFSRVPPAAPPVEPDPEGDRAFATIRALEGLKAEERRLRHRLRVLPKSDPERERIASELEELQAQEARTVAAREAELNAG